MKAQNPDPKPKLEPLHTSITITESISAQTPANITVLDERTIEETPGVNVDDRLRTVPGFSLFRRSSSLVAHPTTQGVSLRGLGSSGASRTLVLWDGVPENDPFGGWLYWDRFDPAELDRIEVSRGASTSVFGDRALSGAIALFSVPVDRRRVHLGYEGGNRNTHELSAGGVAQWRVFALSGNLRAFTTGGYFIVPAHLRGAADRRAGSRFAAGDLRMDFFGGQNRLFLRFDVLAEHRENGAALQTNSTGLGSLAAHFSHQWTQSEVSLIGYHTREAFRSAFSSIAPDRNTERITFRQTVPSEATGGALTWRTGASRWNALAGADAQRVEGFSTDRLFPSGLRVGGGSQLQHGVFAQADALLGPARFFAGARHHYTASGQTFFSPSAGVAAGKGLLRGRFSAYRSFRAPTLNELYREFRVGNVITQANPLLRPETLKGIEAGADLVGESTHAGITLFRNSLENIITNVTLRSSQSLIVRQRGNAAAALARGAEATLDHRWRSWSAGLAYLYADSRFRTGERLPQVPRHQGNAQLTYVRGGTLASFGVRSFSAQFDDDRNQFLLPGSATLQLALRQSLGKQWSALAEFENLLDRSYLSAFSPTPTTGAPRLWRAGLRWDFR